MEEEAIQEGKDNPVNRYYHFWLLGIIIAVIIFFKKYWRKINGTQLTIYFWITLLSSYFWQTRLYNFPGDIKQGVTAWMFYIQNILSSVLFLGGTFEDTCLFHVFGMLFGYFLAIYGFKIFKKSKKDYPVLKIIVFSVLFILLLLAAIFLDYSSRMSFVVFALPGFLLFLSNYKSLNIIRFLLYVPCMLLFVFIWDWTSVIGLEKLGEIFAKNKEDAIFWRAWFYLKDGVHSLVYSNKKWAWICGKLPLSIDVIYPLSGIILQVGLLSFLKTRMLHEQGET